MSKKIWYSQPLSEMWSSYNKSNKNGDLSPYDFIHDWMDPQINNPFLPDGSSVQTNILISELFYADTKKEFLHLYFVDKSLRDFLIDLPIHDFEGLTKFIIENGKEIEDGCITTFGQQLKTDNKSTIIDFGIHIPYENKNKGYAFSFTYKPENGKLLFTWLVGQNAGFFTADQYEELIKKNNEYSKQILSYFRLALNTIAYMNTFPECIVDGVPNQIKDEYCKKIEIAEKVIEIKDIQESGKTVSPHFRRGYFKRLSSDFFTHKKGQTVFVRETMVNGKAKTVYTTSNLDKMVE